MAKDRVVARKRGPDAARRNEISIDRDFLRGLLKESVVGSARPSRPPTRAPTGGSNGDTTRGVVTGLSRVSGGVNTVSNEMSGLRGNRSPRPGSRNGGNSPTPKTMNGGSSSSRKGAPGRASNILSAGGIITGSRRLSPSGDAVSAAASSFVGETNEGDGNVA